MKKLIMLDNKNIIQSDIYLLEFDCDKHMFIQRGTKVQCEIDFIIDDRNRFTLFLVSDNNDIVRIPVELLLDKQFINLIKEGNDGNVE